MKSIFFVIILIIGLVPYASAAQLDGATYSTNRNTQNHHSNF